MLNAGENFDKRISRTQGKKNSNPLGLLFFFLVLASVLFFVLLTIPCPLYSRQKRVLRGGQGGTSPPYPRRGCCRTIRDDVPLMYIKAERLNRNGVRRFCELLNCNDRKARDCVSNRSACTVANVLLCCVTAELLR